MSFDEANIEDDDLEEEGLDEEVQELMEEHDLDADTAEKAKEIMEEEGVDEDEAVALAQEP